MFSDLPDDLINLNHASQLLMKDGDYTKQQAKIILNHSRQYDVNGITYVRNDYIKQRVLENNNKVD